MIERASIDDLPAIKRLTESCALALQEKGIFQWNKHYPSLERLEKDTRLRELFVLKEEDTTVGIIVLTPTMDEEYTPIEWLSPNDNNLYVHRLAVHPASWGRGYGQKLMDFAESFAEENAYRSVRLDTFSQNTRNQKFYEARGYVRLGDIYFPKQSAFPFHCYEKILG